VRIWTIRWPRTWVSSCENGCEISGGEFLDHLSDYQLPLCSMEFDRQEILYLFCYVSHLPIVVSVPSDLINLDNSYPFSIPRTHLAVHCISHSFKKN
jgi:hypothetical protein